MARRDSASHLFSFESIMHNFLNDFLSRKAPPSYLSVFMKIQLFLVPGNVSLLCQRKDAPLKENSQSVVDFAVVKFLQ